MTRILYIPPIGKNRIWSETICDGSDVELTVRDGRVFQRKKIDMEESNKLYCDMYPQFCIKNESTV